MSLKRPNDDADHLDSGRRPPGPRAARIRACAECKRHKIKCEPVDDEQKCAKCLRSGVDCVPYNINQKILDEDATWKANAAAELNLLRSAVQRLLRHNHLPDLGHESDPTEQSTVGPTVTISPVNVVSENGVSATMLVPPMDMTRENSVERDLDEEPGLVSAPMRSLYELTRIRTLRSSIRWNPKSNSMDDDFIAHGIVSKEDAEDLFQRYITNLHQYLWAGVLCRHTTLEAARRHSTLLTAAVLTIAALHTPGRDESLQKCYHTFVSLTYNACLTRLDNLDDIRALALAAFYLSNLSWKLSGLAVRNAVEMNVHHSFQKLMRGNESQRDNVRLWYALYVCEHQFSIAYGRPPIIHEADYAIKNLEQFLDSPHTTQGDIRLGAQIALFKILTEAYLAYGSDPEQPLTETDFQQLRMFNFAIEQWRLAFQPRSADHSGIGSYPSKGVVLYYHFARFQLNSLALRALPPPSAASSESLSYDRREAANIAISAATNTLTLIFEEPDLRRAMTAVPIFTHTMVAFCATFLLKMARTWGGVAQAASPEWTTEPIGLGLNFNISQVLSLSRRATNFLSKVAENLNEKHLTNHIVHGIQELLKHFDGSEMPPVETKGQGGALPAGLQPMATTNGTSAATGVDQGAEMLNGYTMYDLIGSYGFGFDETFLGQAASTDFDIWPNEPL